MENYSDYWNEINQIVDHKSIQRGYIVRDGFFFESIRHPSNVFMVGMPNTVGSIDVTGNILDEQNTGYGCIFITGTTQFMGMSIPTGWLSTAMSANVTKADLTAMKFSATISATMEDFVSYVTEGLMGSSETKTFTASLQNVSLVDIYAMMGK